MKHFVVLRTAVLVPTVALVSWSGWSQQFQNLDFEGQWSNGGIPGWTATSFPFDRSDFHPVSYIYPNNQALNLIDQSTVGVIVNTYPAPYPAYPQPIDGNQSLWLSAVPFGGPSASVTSISQTGTVPSAARSILFQAADLGGAEGGAPAFGLSFGGNQLAVKEVLPATSAGVIGYGANIFQYAGQTGDLVLSLSGGDVWGVIDDVQFSNVAVPETTWAASTWAAGGVVLAIWLVRGKRALMVI